MSENKDILDNKTSDEEVLRTNKSASDTYENPDASTSPKKLKPWMFITSGVILVLLVGFLCLPLTLPKDKIASNVWSGDINLGKLSISEAEALLDKSYTPESINFSVAFSHNGRTEKAVFSSKDIDYSIDPKETAMIAFNTGRSKNILKNSWDVLRSFFTKVDIGKAPKVNDEKLTKILYNLGAKVHGEGTDVQYIIEQDILTIIPATPGQSFELSVAKGEFLQSVRMGKYTNIPVTLKSNQEDKLDSEKVYQKLACEPVDAEYKIDGKNVTITDHKVGIKIDKAKLAALVDRVNNKNQGSIEITTVLPQKTREVLEKELFGTVLGTFTSDYSSSSQNRAFNVELAASKVNGVILVDGEEFSYNGVVGNANAKNGFKLATIFSGGQVTEGVGGGVCQISSTLYCAALRADLEIIERHNHSLPIAYVPGGQDATVSYGILDFRFKNNTGSPIKIVATHQNRKVTVSIIGSASAKKKVDVSSSKLSSVAPAVLETPDPTLPLGERKVTEKGKSGSVYMMYKRVYAPDGKLVSESSVRSVYKATPEKVLVGTGEAVTTDAPVINPENPDVTPPSETNEPDIKDTPDTPSETTPEDVDKPETPSPSEDDPEVSDTPIDIE